MCRARIPQEVAFTAAAALLLAGCATLGRRGPVPEEVATCRELTQQGVSAMELGDWAKAESLLERAVEASPVDSTSRFHFAETLWHRGATDEALLQIEAAIRLDGTDAVMFVRAGEMLLATGATDKALARAEQAIRLNPKLATAWALRGRAYARLGQTERALPDLQRALQFAPYDHGVLMEVAALYREQGQYDRCLATVQHLLDTCPAGEEPQSALWMEGLALLELGRPRQAADRLAVASRQGPPNADILYYLAQAQMASGQTEAATAAARQAVEINPAHEPSRKLLAELARKPAPQESVVR